MTLLEVAKHALEAMEDAMYRADTHEFYDAKESLRYAIEQAEQAEQEPVAWMFQHEETGRTMCVDAQQVEWGFEKGNPRLKKIAPLYTAPTPRKPLTDEEIDRVTDQQWAQNNHKPIYAAHRAYARALERAHGIGEQQ